MNTITKLTPEETATTLKSMLGMKFWGKEAGRFKITRELLGKLTGRRFIKEEFIAAVAEAGMDQGISVIDIGDAFAVLETHILEGFRTVPPAIVQKIAVSIG